MSGVWLVDGDFDGDFDGEWCLTIRQMVVNSRLWLVDRPKAGK